MLGNFDDARRLVAGAAATYEELGHRLFRAGLSEVAGPIELLAGRPDEAERELRTGFDLLAATGDTALLGSPALLLVDVMLAQGRHEEARHFLEIGAAAMAQDDMTNLVLANAARARIRLLDGELAEAEEAARKAVETAACTDAVVSHADALAVLGDVLKQADRPDAAAAARASALALYEQKGPQVAAKRLREPGTRPQRASIRPGRR
jgi:tetratricopeptide (TPR) repeat protein